MIILRRICGELPKKAKKVEIHERLVHFHYVQRWIKKVTKIGHFGGDYLRKTKLISLLARITCVKIYGII